MTVVLKTPQTGQAGFGSRDLSGASNLADANGVKKTWICQELDLNSNAMNTHLLSLGILPFQDLECLENA